MPILEVRLHQEGERVKYLATNAVCDRCREPITTIAFVFVRKMRGGVKITTACAHDCKKAYPPIFPSQNGSYDMQVHIVSTFPRGARPYFFQPVPLTNGKVSVFEAARNPQSVESETTGMKTIDRAKIATRDTELLTHEDKKQLPEAPQ